MKQGTQLGHAIKPGYHLLVLDAALLCWPLQSHCRDYHTQPCYLDWPATHYYKARPSPHTRHTRMHTPCISTASCWAWPSHHHVMTTFHWSTLHCVRRQAFVLVCMQCASFSSRPWANFYRVRDKACRGKKPPTHREDTLTTYRAIQSQSKDLEVQSRG